MRSRISTRGRRSTTPSVVFYREVVFDEILARVFEEVAEVDWAVHIPNLIDYWCRVLLGEPGYDGRFLAAHQHVHRLEALRVAHFDRWYALWEATIDARWRGQHADAAKAHASHMGAVLARRILSVDWSPGAGTIGEDAARIGPWTGRHDNY